MLHRGRFDTVLGRVSFDAKGDLEGASWQWQMWRNGTYGPVPRPLAVMR
jgi:branched-chain amino acid transport system substrate-binding protein